jgi:hypothetical protein
MAHTGPTSRCCASLLPTGAIPLSTTDDLLAQLLGRNSDLFTTYETWSNAQILLLAGRIDDPDSFNASGGKTGALGYYPVANVNGETVYVPCVARMQAIAAGGTDPVVLEGLLSAQVAAAETHAAAAAQARSEVETTAAALLGTQNDQIKATLDLDTIKAKHPLSPRFAYPGFPTGRAINGALLGQWDIFGRYKVGGLLIRTDTSSRFKSPYVVLFGGVNGEHILRATHDGRAQIKGLDFRFPAPSSPRWTVRSHIIIGDKFKRGMMIWKDNSFLLPIHPDSPGLGGNAIPENIMGGITQAGSNRTAILSITGKQDTGIAVDQDITEIAGVQTGANNVCVLVRTQSGSRQIKVPLQVTVSQLISVATNWGITIYGQSNGEGYINPSFPDPAIHLTPINPGRAMMLDRGERILGTGQGPSEFLDLVDRATLTGFVDLAPKNQGVGSQTIGPTLAAGICAQQSASIGLVVSNASIGSTNYDERKKGTPPYNNLLVGVERKTTISRLSGREYEERFLVLIEGEKDRGYSKSSWMTFKIDERNNIDIDIKRITRQFVDLISVSDQMGYERSDIPLAQVQLAIDYPAHFICSGPRYHLPVALSDNIHNSTLAREIQGYEISRAINLWLAGTMPEPFRIVSATLSGRNGVGTFGGHFAGSVTIDTSIVTDPGNYGLNFMDDGNGNSVSIVPDSVTMISNNQVAFNLSAVPTGSHPRLGTARIPNVQNIGPIYGPRSCFFDQAPDTCTIGGVTYNLRRPACIWETPIIFV